MEIHAVSHLLNGHTGCLHFLMAETCSASSISCAHEGIAAAAVASWQWCSWDTGWAVPSSDHHVWVDVAIAGYGNTLVEASERRPWKQEERSIPSLMKKPMPWVHQTK